MLNEQLNSPHATRDEAIAGVMQLTIDEWYWGEAKDLRAHFSGLRELIRLRGGPANLGMEGILSKQALVCV